jgi:hypothetical protein
MLRRNESMIADAEKERVIVYGKQTDDPSSSQRMTPLSLLAVASLHSLPMYR